MCVNSHNKNRMTHPLRVAKNCTTHPLPRVQKLMTHPLSAPAHPPQYFLTSPLTFLDIIVSIEGNNSCTNVNYKPTGSQSYLFCSSSHPAHVKNLILYSQFLRLRRLCSEDSEEMCDFFDKRGYPASVVQAGHHRARQIETNSELQRSQKENPRNHAVKSVIPKHFKLFK